MLKRFKTPIIATAVAFLLAVILSVIMISVIVNSNGSDREKAERSGKAGGAVATLFVLTTAPFWIFTAAKIGAERRRKK